MSVKAYDINSDYVLVAWKPPNTVNEAAITGYFVDRSVCTLKTPQDYYLNWQSSICFVLNIDRMNSAALQRL